MRWCAVIGLVVSHFNSALQFLVGPWPNGAVRVASDGTLDLQKGCDKQKCPSVVIFTGNQHGTIELSGCTVGQLYFFVNKSQSDLGIVVQQKGGLFGALPLAQFANGSCFCYPRGAEEETRERRLLDEQTPADVQTSELGVLLCG